MTNFEQALQHGQALQQAGKSRAAQVFLQGALERWEEVRAGGGVRGGDRTFLAIGADLRSTLGLALADLGAVEEALEAFSAANSHGLAVKFLVGHSQTEDRLLSYLQDAGVAALMELTPLLRRRFSARDYAGAFRIAQRLPFYSGAPHTTLLRAQNPFGKLDLVRALFACVQTRGEGSIATLDSFLVHLKDRDSMDTFAGIPVPGRFQKQSRVEFEKVVASLYGSWEATLASYRQRTATEGYLQNLHGDGKAGPAPAPKAAPPEPSGSPSLLSTILESRTNRTGIQGIFSRLAEDGDLRVAREDLLHLPPAQQLQKPYSDRALDAIDILARELDSVLARTFFVDTRLMLLQCLGRDLTATDLVRMAWPVNPTQSQEAAWQLTAERRIELFSDRGRRRILDIFANPSQRSRVMTRLAQVACQSVLGLVTRETIGQLETRFSLANARELRVRGCGNHDPLPWVQSLLTRDINEECRVREGIPLEGEGWVNQGTMVALLRRLFAPHEVLTEASPKGLGAQRFDAFIPDLRLAVEYQGEQHYLPIRHWGGEEGLLKRKAADSLKLENSCQVGIRVEYIHYFENLQSRCVEIANQALRPAIPFKLANESGAPAVENGRPIDRRVTGIARQLVSLPTWRATLKEDPTLGSELERRQALAVAEAIATGVRDPERLALECPALRLNEPYKEFAARVARVVESRNARLRRPPPDPGSDPEGLLMEYFRQYPEPAIKALVEAGCAPDVGLQLLMLNRDCHLDFRAAFELYGPGQGILLIDLHRLLGRIQAMLPLA